MMNHSQSQRRFATHAGRVALVTGAARGLGQEMCRGLAESGAVVIGVDLLDQSTTAQVVREAGAKWKSYTLDVTAESAVNELAGSIQSEFGRCDVLINNAGIADGGTWDDLDYALWRRIINVNLDSQFLMAKAVVPLMKSKSYGRILNITSTTVVAQIDNFIAYRVSKMGVIGLTRALASLGNFGITSNAISPSLTPTDLTRGVGIPQEIFSGFVQGQSIKRMATPRDIVPTAIFLTSEDSYWVTGQSFSADGGASFCLS
jgi:NAD(P)-dependent dehydrogenase (short-subunit alcohol dehydrogenase family)